MKSDIEQYKALLKLSSEHLKPSTQTQLDINRQSIVNSLEANSLSVQSRQKLTLWQPITALALPAFIAIFALFFPMNNEFIPPQTDIYTDLEILLEADELDFLDTMEISEWLVSDSGQ